MPTWLNEKRIVSVFIFLVSLVYIHAVFYGSGALYSSFTDDFYYYLKIAKSVYNGNNLTFTEGVVTNGYQPVFQYLIIVLYAIAQRLHIESLLLIKLFFGAVFYVSSYVLYKELQPKTPLAVLFFCIAVLSYFSFSYNGMESLLIIPLLSFVVLRMVKGTINPYWVSAAIPMAFFLRIDSIIILLQVAVLYLIKQKALRFRNFRQLLVLAAIAFLPIVIYMILNYITLGVPVPVSGIAKSATHLNTVHSATFRSFKGFGWHANLIAVFALLAGLYLAIKKSNSALRWLLFMTLFFYLQNAVRSDWKIWDWYLYPFSVLLFVITYFADSIAFNMKGRPAVVPLLVTSAVGGLLFLKIIAYLKPYENMMFQAAVKIQNFENGHKGNYAMGDRAGIVGYLIPSKLVQLEGLVMDKAYLNTLAKAHDVNDLTSPYHVDYYITTNPVALSDSTFVVKEPMQSNGASPKITDTISWKVLYDFTISESKNARSKKVRTVIFKTP